MGRKYLAVLVVTAAILFSGVSLVKLAHADDAVAPAQGSTGDQSSTPPANDENATQNNEYTQPQENNEPAAAPAPGNADQGSENGQQDAAPGASGPDTN